MKKILTAFLVLVMALSCFAFIGCKDQGDMQATLDMYIFDKDGQTVAEDFVLPGYIGQYKTTWTSDNEVIALEELAEDKEGGIERQYVAKVGLPEERTEINLTVSLSASIKKTYTVYVNALSVYDFSTAYKFRQINAMVVADFDLDTTYEVKGQTATIAWSVEEEYADYIEISEDGTKCIVYPTSINPIVRINATFTYNGESTTKGYRMTVSEHKEPLQEVDFWYTNTGVGITMSGYVVSIATAYDSGKGSVSLYMVNDEFTAGYYLYGVKVDSANAALLAPGVHITVTGTTNTDYNGLIETNKDGNLVVDGDIPAINVSEKVYAIDNDVLGNLQSAYYHQSRLVSLTNWSVKEIKSAVQEGKTGTLFVLTKGGVDVSIAVSKYMESAYLCKAEDATWSALANLQNTLKVGDIVSVTGILGNYKGHQIMPLNAAAVVVGGTADADGTVYAGQKVAKAVAAIDKLIADNGLDSIVAVAKNVALPVSVEGCEVAYRIIGAPRTISIVEGALVIAPDKMERACLTATVTVDGFTTNIFRYIDAADLSDADKIDMEIEAFDFEIKSEIASDTKVELPASGSIFNGVAITWTLNGEAISGSANFVCGAVEAAYTLVATFELNGVTKSVTYEGKVLAGAGSKSVELTVKSLAIAENSYVKGTAKVGAVEFEYVELGNYGNGIQMRNKTVASTLWNTTAIDISKIELIYTASQANFSNADALKFEFSNNADFSGAYVTFLSTEKGKVDAYTVQADATYKYVRITNNLTYSLYWDSITVYYKASGDAPVECEHEWSEATCQAPKTCSKCGATEGDALGHDYVENVCSRCQAVRVTTIADALDASEGTDAILTGQVCEIYEAWSSYNNMSVYITDGTDRILVFRTKTQVAMGDKITVAGTITIYQEVAQIAAGTTAEIVEKHTEHTYVDGKCSVCGAEEPACEHVGKWVTTHTTHTEICSICEAVITAEASHTFEDGLCACGADNLLTGAEFNTLGAAQSEGGYTSLKFRVTGVITSLKSTTYGNLYIKDAEGTQVYIYGLYSEDGKRYDAMSVKPGVGDTITVLTICGNYYGDPQGKNATLLTHEVHTCSSTGEWKKDETNHWQLCDLCGVELNKASHTVVEGACVCGYTEDTVLPTTASVVIQDYASANSWENGTQYTTVSVDENITVTATGTDANTGKYYTSGYEWRTYQTGNPDITVTAAEGYTIVSVKITYSISKTGILTLNGSNVASGTEVTVNASSITFGVGNTGTATNGQVKITAIEVVYIAE